MAGDETDETDKSPGGSTIIRRKATERPWTPAAASEDMEAIEAHFEEFFGPVETVFHEVMSDLVHVDVHVIPPHDDRDSFTLFTTGMSALPMTVPEKAADLRFAELVLSLPRDWNMEGLAVLPPRDEDRRWYWPIRWLKMLARYPHDYRTWLGSLHSMPNGDPPAPFSEETKLCAWWLVPPISVPREGRTIELRERTVHIYCLHALHEDELAMKLEQGSNALLDAFEEHRVSEVLQLDRPSVVR